MNTILVERCDQASYLKQKGYELGNVYQHGVEVKGITSEDALKLINEMKYNFSVSRSDYERDTRWLLYLRRKKAKGLDSKIRNNK